jgi:hypothetical protein
MRGQLGFAQLEDVMSVEITARDCKVELAWLGGGSPNLPDAEDLRLSARVVCREFAGASGDTWVLGSAWRVFLLDMSHLERSRRGSARIESLSPDELVLEFRAVDALGHIVVAGHVSQRRPSVGGEHEARLEFAFDFDPGLLADVVREFHNLRADRGMR